MLKDIDEKYEGKLKTLVFELEVKHQVSINMKKALLFNYEPDFKPKFEHNISYQESYKWYQVGSIDRITKEIIWESN